jgi:RHH-type rel operon transcriptional repressor/antitoxin RelB
MSSQKMLAPRLPPDIERRLDALAKKTGRSKSYYAREAILRQIEDIEDYYLARRRLGRRGARDARNPRAAARETHEAPMAAATSRPFV